MKHKLLTREQFKQAVFERDGFRCVMCGEPAVDAHHILDRRLWPDGGYYLDNGAALCEGHHFDAERTYLHVEEIRQEAGIDHPIIPPHLDADQRYDKWGNIVLSNGMRTRGELFFDDAVQKVLAWCLSLFTNRVKYGRTYHLPWSEGINSDDKALSDTDQFIGKQVVVTQKLDGENTTMYSDYIHARSIDGRSHPSRDWVKKFHSSIAHEIPTDWRVCGENLFATHSIHYENLSTYFYGFSIWNEKNTCLSWSDTLEWFELLGIEPVPTLYRGMWNEGLVRFLWNDKDRKNQEGYVVRIEDCFEYKDFKKSVAKFVRKCHVQTDKHWMANEIIPNELIK